MTEHDDRAVFAAMDELILATLLASTTPLSIDQIAARGGLRRFGLSGRLQTLKHRGLVRVCGRTNGARWCIASAAAAGEHREDAVDTSPLEASQLTATGIDLDERLRRLAERLQDGPPTGAHVRVRRPRGVSALITSGQARLLQLLSERPCGITPTGLMALTGFKLSTMETYLPKLRSIGYVDTLPDGRLVITPAGQAMLPRAAGEIE